MENILQTVYYSREMLTNSPHFHDCHQIVFILKGSVEFCINGKVLQARAGDLALFSRYENHSFRILSKEYERYIMQLSPGIVNQQSPVYSLLTDRPDGFCPVIDVSAFSPQVEGLFRQLQQEHSGQNRLKGQMEQLLIEQLLITLYRCTNLKLRDGGSDIVLEIKRRLENRFSEPYTLEQLAHSHGISVSSLAHRFRAVTGTSVIDFLQACRMAHAKRLLAETDSSIGRIVEQCGFSDSSNFSRAFKAQNGLTPSAFRRRHRQAT